MNEQEVEKEIVEKGLTAPRLTPEIIDSKIMNKVFWNPAGTTLTVAVLVLENGTFVVGESACVSKDNFDPELGQKIAFKNAREKIWVLEGYLLKQQLHDSQV